MRVLVTGATGFVGRAVASRLLLDSGVVVRAAARRPPADPAPSPVERALVEDLGPHTDWRAALDEVDAIVHTAARVHVMRDVSADPLAEFRRVNVDGTLALARQAAAAGVRRFVFISSIKVNGEATKPDRPYRARDVPAPMDPYGMSKLEAEQGLREIAASTTLQVSIIRPVLVYGPGVKGNFRSMLRWIRRGIPLPLGAVDNRRSLVALENLVDLIATCLRHESAANRTFLVSDGEDLSTPELLRRAGEALGTRTRLVPVAPALLKGIARMVGRENVAARLCDSLQVDISETRAILGWQPPVPVRDALAATVAEFTARGVV
jgi:nucleoside-diphosphate-sugar epimerase